MWNYHLRFDTKLDQIFLTQIILCVHVKSEQIDWFYHETPQKTTIILYHPYFFCGVIWGIYKKCNIVSFEIYVTDYCIYEQINRSMLFGMFKTIKFIVIQNNVGKNASNKKKHMDTT